MYWAANNERARRMVINQYQYTVGELRDMLVRRELVVNREFQRDSGLWPPRARGNFISNLLEGFPIPKLCVREIMGESIRSPRKELIDGQQRVAAVRDFLDNKFEVDRGVWRSGPRFRDLHEEERDRLLSYPVSVDVVRNASKSEVLRIIRSLNGHSSPLNETEKRHLGYSGEFKWFINGLCDELGEFFLGYGVFTDRQIIRMADAEFLADTILAGERGIMDTKPRELREIYRARDYDFQEAEHARRMIRDSVDYLVDNFHDLGGSHMMKPFALHSLMTAMIHARFGIAEMNKQIRGEFGNKYCVDPKTSSARLLELAAAHEAMEIDGPHSRYVWGCGGATGGPGKRLARVLGIFWALGYPDVEVINNDLARRIPSQAR